MVWFWAILGILAILLTGSYFCAQAAFRVPKNLEKYLYRLPHTPQYSPYAKQVREMIDKALAIPYEDVWTTSQDGLRLHGKFYPAADPKAPVQILCHGYQSMNTAMPRSRASNRRCLRKPRREIPSSFWRFLALPEAHNNSVRLSSVCGKSVCGW